MTEKLGLKAGGIKMLINQRTLALCLFAVSVAGLCSYATIGSNPESGALQESPSDIPFNDPSHGFFFKYQSYLAEHGKGGDTSETWRDLTRLERTKRVTDGEALLKEIHLELLAKDKLSDEESELVWAVWGQGALTENSNWGNRLVVTQDKLIPIAIPKQKINALSEKVRGFQKHGNWGHLFDGGKNSLWRFGEVNTADIYNQRNGPDIKTSLKSWKVSYPNEPQVLPAGRAIGLGHNDSNRKTLPFAAAGVVLLTCLYCGLNVLKRKDLQTGTSGMDDEFPTIKELAGKGSGFAKIKDPLMLSCGCECEITCGFQCGCTCTCQLDCGCTCTANCGCTCNCTCTCAADCGCAANAQP